jgi:hypothetical protein
MSDTKTSALKNAKSSSLTASQNSQPNLPLHLAIERNCHDMQFGQITYTFKIKDGVVDMKTLNIVMADRKRY